VHSFIIKLRLEKDLGEAGPTTCHGYITHVPGGEQSYLRDLDGVAAFIMPYLEASGVRVGLCWRVSRWLRGLRSKAAQAASRER
jgi:hypothetical protein